MTVIMRAFIICVGLAQASRFSVDVSLTDGVKVMNREDRIEELKSQIFGLVGLDTVKESMRTLLDLVEFGKMREQKGLHGFSAQSLHMRFLGNPGTGKTVVARLVGELLLLMGAITPPENAEETNSSGFVFKEAARADLVGEHTGETALKVQQVVKEALGGVLFIDEAYALVQGNKDSFGVEAVDTLIKEMEDNRANLIVILAGYTKEMEDFFNSNPGFQSRVPFSFSFTDYTCPELVRIGELQLKGKTMALKAGDGSDSTQYWLRRSAQLNARCCDEDDKSKCDMSKTDRSNGNGRTMRNILESSFRAMALRVLKSTQPATLQSFYESLPTSPPDCTNNPDLRCKFTLLEASDIKATTLDLLNLNLAPCRSKITLEQMTGVSSDPKRWVSLSEVLVEVSEAKTGSRSKLEDICSRVNSLMGSALIEVKSHQHGEAFLELEDVEMEGIPTGFSELTPSGYCKDKFGSMSPTIAKRGVSIDECGALCKKKGACKAFDFYSGVCNIYTRSKPVGTRGRRTARCFTKRAAPAQQGGKAPMSPRRRGGAGAGSPRRRSGPSGSSGASGSPYSDRRRAPGPPKPTKPRPVGRFNDRKEAEKALQEEQVPEGNNEEVDRLMKKLNGLVGLVKVKAGMAELRAMVEFDQWRKKLLPDSKSLMGQSFHMQFLGNPGTGKTVVARLVGKLLVEMGVIKKDKEKEDHIFHEVSRADLVAQYVGQTAPKVISAVGKAIGGVLFVDEAYSLKKEGKDSFGQEAVDTLIKEIEDKRDQVIAIFAGYELEMETFFDANPGFKSRVPFKFYFDDYSCEELSQIAGIFMKDKGFTASESAEKWINRTVRFSTGCCSSGEECEALRDSGNGRTVRNILEASYRNFASRIVPRLHYSKKTGAVLQRLEEYARLYKENWPEYEVKYRPSKKRARERLNKDFGKDAACSKQPSGLGATWKDLCEEAKSSLTILQGEDLALVAASRFSESLLAPCRDAKKDMKELDELSAAALQEIDETTWEEAAEAARNGNCEGTFEALKKVTITKPPPVYDNLRLMEESEALKPLLEKLRKLVGLKSVKEAMGQLFGLVKLSTWRERLDMESLAGQSFHMRFLGNPGTGKTVVARIVGEMMVKMGVVSVPKDVQKKLKKEAREASIKAGEEVEPPLIWKEGARVDLVAQYVGQTAPKVEKAVSEALGGVLFIDEAYALVRNGKDKFGQEAVDTLIKEMEDKRKNVIVILAGYESEMDDFFDSNPGFKSRVPFTFRFEDYSCTELGQIGGLGLVVAPDASPRLEDLIAFTSGCCNNVADADCHPSRENGNGRTVRNVIEALQRAMARRVVQSKLSDPESLRTLKIADLTLVAEQQASTRLEAPCGVKGLVRTLATATETKGGLVIWSQQYTLSDPRKQLYRMVRESQRLGKSLKNFESTKLVDLEKQCSTGLADLADKLQKKVTSTCVQSLPKLTGEIDKKEKLTVAEFEAMMKPLEMTSREAVKLMRLFDSEDVPSPLDKIQPAAMMNCGDALDNLRSKSVLAPLEMAVRALNE